MSDIDTGVVDSLKVLDPDGRLEKRTSRQTSRVVRFVASQQKHRYSITRARARWAEFAGRALRHVPSGKLGRLLHRNITALQRRRAATILTFLYLGSGSTLFPTLTPRKCYAQCVVTLSSIRFDTSANTDLTQNNPFQKSVIDVDLPSIASVPARSRLRKAYPVPSP